MGGFKASARCVVSSVLLCVLIKPALGKCKYGDVVRCPDGNMCEGNQCCRDGSTCPSAHKNFKCAKPKSFDCMGPEPPTPQPPTPQPPAPPSPQPPTPQPPSPDFCTTAACCKAKVTLQSAFDGQICDEFYSSGAGVAISMLKTNTWAWRDAGSLFTAEPRSKMDANAAQSISIIGSSKPSHPYASYGPNAGKWGIVSSIARDGNFWKYFTYCPKPATVCAQCTDGFACPLKSAPGIAREVLPASFSYDQFKKEKDEVYAQTGTSACKQPHPNQYNEFNTNGLSKSGLGGIFIVNSGGAASRNHEPSARDVCKFMAMANETRATPWPLYVYDVPHHSTRSSLYIAKYLDCNSQDVVVV